MTRINVVPVAELTDKHLLAEYRELPRIFRLAKNWLQRQADGRRFKAIPARYTLGRGHVTFFYDKLGYCYDRQRQLFDECKRRGFDVKHEPSSELIDWAPSNMLRTYRPTGHALMLNRERIATRLDEAAQRRTAKR